MQRLFVILLLLSITLLSHENTFQAKVIGHKLIIEESDYDTLWKEAEQLVKAGKPKSAIKIVEGIYELAIKEKNANQQIKAILHIIKFKRPFEEESDKKNISYVEDEIERADFPVKPILYSILAELYRQYSHNNYYKILERSVISGEISDDIYEWDSRTLINRIVSLHKYALASVNDLQNTPVEEFDIILKKGTADRRIRPTLYDLLMHRAIDYYKREGPDLIKPVEEYVPEGRKLMVDAKTFTKIQIETPDTMSSKYLTIRAFQELERFHFDNKNLDALVLISLERLDYLKSISSFDERDKLYYKILQQLDKEYSELEISTDIVIKKARHIYNGYRPEDLDTTISLKKEALRICEQAIEDFPESVGAKACSALRSTILAKTLKVKIEQVVLPNTHGKFMVEYKNVKNIYIRLVEIDEKTYDEIFKLLWEKEKLHKKFIGLKPIHSEFVELPLPEDYEVHRTEIKLPKLDYGRYLILVSAKEDFGLDKNKIKYAFFQASRLTMISHSERGGLKLKCYVLDLKTGEYLKNVKVDIYKQENKARKKLATFITDKNGYFELEKNSYGNFHIILSKGEDVFHFSNWLYSYGYSGKKSDFIRTFLFTDRSIYRPGQTVYFKGIVIRSNHNKTVNELQVEYKTKVEFFDVNYQKIIEKEFITNEFGSFQGSFNIPTGMLNGRMKISEKNGNTVITVEEYKRPKFEVILNPVTKSFRLDEVVAVSGYAKSYSGISITDATVKYHIVRNASFPFWWDWWRPQPASPEKEILSGELKTDSDGKFEFDFIAIPDKSISKETKPVFNYSVYVDVVDINGETQSSKKIVRVGYVAVKGSFSIPAWIPNNESFKFGIYTTNLDGNKINLEGILKIKKLDEPKKLLRKKSWQNVDQFVIPETEYDSIFQYDAYTSMNEELGNLKRKLILKKKLNSNEEIEFLAKKMRSFLPGRYEICFETTDTFGNTVEIKKSFNIYNPSAKDAAIREFSYFIPVMTYAKPGEKAKFIWGSGHGNVTAMLIVEKKGKIVETRMLNVDNGQEIIEIPVDETDRGGFSIQLVMITEGRFYNHNGSISVPWDNKRLDISLETFRSNLEPGTKETWKLKISGPDNEKVTAELLAGMYDASLDAITGHSWSFSIYPYFYNRISVSTFSTFSNAYVNELSKDWYKYIYFSHRKYDNINFLTPYRGRLDYGVNLYMVGGRDRYSDGEMALAEEAEMSLGEEEEIELDRDENISLYAMNVSKKKKNGDKEVMIRKNLNETAFFYPQLLTNESGQVEFSFTSPEALTKWKLMLLAHTKDLKTGQKGKTVITQKKLMLTPNVPRFMRVGDTIYFSSKLSNLSEEILNGEVELQLLNAYTMSPINQKFSLNESKLEYQIKKKENLNFKWKIVVPDGIEAVVYRVIARSNKFSDGEENFIPILPDKILVTESMPFYVKEKQTKSYKFEKLLNSKNSSTLRHHALTLEITPNPAWYAVMALPYMMEFPYECTEQIFNRYYANVISVELINSNPGIKNVFEGWKNLTASGKGTLLSNLEKNEDLKSILLQETPWVIEGKNETEQRRRIGILFDENRMNDELGQTLKKLEERQLSGGAWPWFKGMYESRYITQYIVGGIGHIQKLGLQENNMTDNMLKNAIQYMDRKIAKDYDYLLKYKTKLNQNNLGYTQIQYLYSRSFFKEIKIPAKSQKAFEYYKGQAEKYWLDFNLMSKGMLSLALNRFGSTETAKKIIVSLKEYSTANDEMGMYWKTNTASYYWYSAPIETQSVMIEAFDEVANDQESVNDMKIWLLNQKRVQSWRTTKATADACYALLLRGADWLTEGDGLAVYIDNKEFELDNSVKEPGTGYIKKKWTDESVKPEYGNIKLEKNGKGISWGALHWQYFERLDKITPHETPLSIEKEIFLEKITASGPVLEKVNSNKVLNIGDLLKIRVVLRVDRAMEFIHLKDMRAAALEPVKTKSGYVYQGGIGYYVSIKDASVNFFFDRIPKGTYVFEYSLRVSQEGTFQNGITTAQCMYAPEFNSHSQGAVIKVLK